MSAKRKKGDELVPYTTSSIMVNGKTGSKGKKGKESKKPDKRNAIFDVNRLLDDFTERYCQEIERRVIAERRLEELKRQAGTSNEDLIYVDSLEVPDEK